MARPTSNSGPTWLWGILLALALILLTTRGRLLPQNRALTERFALQPPQAGLIAGGLPQLSLDSLPLELRQVARGLQERLGLGQNVAPLTPVAQNMRLRVEVAEVRREGAEVRIVGTVTNIGVAEVQVPVSAFELRDSDGATYIAEGGAVARLGPGASTPLDLRVPLPDGRGLLLTLRLPPDPPLEQVLLVDGER